MTKKSINHKETENKIVDEKYRYTPKEGEKLITDKPSVPLLKKEVAEEQKKIKLKEIKSNGQIYEAYIKEIERYKLLYNDKVIYDSTLSKSNSNLIFESDYFILFSKKYSYNGLKIQKI